MPKTRSTQDEIEEFLTVEEYKPMVEKLEEQVRNREVKIAALESELKAQQDKEKEHRQADLNNTYAWMSEAMRLRRLSEMLGEDLMEYKKRAEKAERGLRNMQKWIEISGEKGAPRGPEYL